jgi:tRNA A-37 threonylcarbamoyl transferase component Bud32/tetratricopeptide (TPR) repeat protein
LEVSKRPSASAAGASAAAPTTDTGGPPLPRLARFDVLRPLGNGAAGLVYEAIDRERNERVALKTLRSLDGDALLQLKSEFRAVQDIEHTNLIRLGELIRDGDTWFFTMELVDGANLRAYVTGESSDAASHSTMQSGGSEAGDRAGVVESGRVAHFDEARLRDALAQLARGLVALHAAGKVHRDIKPSNVLVTLSGRVVILDLGLVREMSAASEEFVVGTALYMAPEQVAGEAVEPACDWYAVGVILYLCLTGRHPFDGNASVVMMKKLEEDPPPPSTLVDDVPADLEALCMALLQREPLARPTGVEVLERLGSLAARAAPPRHLARAGQRPFVGRAAEFAVLARAFADVRAGRTVVVVVEGESGVGKSALVRRFTRSLPAVVGELLLLAGRCYEREAVPYKAVDGLIDAVTEFLATLPDAQAEALLPEGTALLTQVFPVLQRVGGADRASSMFPVNLEALGLSEGRSRLFTAVRDLFANLAASYPVVLVIDDLQWADVDSLLLLGELLRPPSAPPLLLVATARTQATRAEGGASFGLPGDVRILPVPRLTAAEGLELTTLLLAKAEGTLDPKMAAMIATEAGGHPLFVDELVRHAQTAGGQALAIGALDDALHARVEQLEAEPRRLLELLAVAGVAVRQEMAMRAAALGFADFATHLKTLRLAHLARTESGRAEEQVETYHDRVREAVASRLVGARRRELHQSLASALEAAPKQDADALATHWLGAGDTARALDYTLKAAEQAYRALAFDRAAQLFGRALESEAFVGEARQHARVRRGDALANVGRGVDAARAYADAAANAKGQIQLDLQRRVAEQLLNAGRFDEGDAALRRVLAGVGLALPRSPITALIGLLLARFVLWLRGMRVTLRDESVVPPEELTRLDACAGVAELMGTVDTIRGAYFQTKTLIYALSAGEPARLAHALALEATFLTGTGLRNAPRAERTFQRAEAIAERLGGTHARGTIAGSRGFSRLFQGRFDEALRLSDEAVKLLREQAVGTFWDLRLSQLVGIWTLSWSGELAELAERVDLRVREADARGDLYGATCLRAGPPSIASLRGDDPARARAVVTTAMRHWTQRGYHNQHYWELLALGQIDLYEGKGVAAYARVTAQWPQMKRSLMLEVQIIRIEATHFRARAAVAAALEAPARRDERLRAARRDARWLTRCGAEYAVPLGEHVLASIAAMRGDAHAARARLESALSRFERLSMHLHAEAVRWRLGHAVGTTGPAGAAGKAHVDAAEAWMRRQGVVSTRRMVAMVSPAPAIARDA